MNKSTGTVVWIGEIQEFKSFRKRMFAIEIEKGKELAFTLENDDIDQTPRMKSLVEITWTPASRFWNGKSASGEKPETYFTQLNVHKIDYPSGENDSKLADEKNFGNRNATFEESDIPF